MWTADQRHRLYLENEVLRREGFDQFTVYHDRTYDQYWASGQQLQAQDISTNFIFPSHQAIRPNDRPCTSRNQIPLRMFDGNPVSSVDISHQMHTLTPHAKGWPQICHWRNSRWHSGIVLQKVFFKALYWIEAYEQHMATGKPLAQFVRTMAEAS